MKKEKKLRKRMSLYFVKRLSELQMKFLSDVYRELLNPLSRTSEELKLILSAVADTLEEFLKEKTGNRCIVTVVVDADEENNEFEAVFCVNREPLLYETGDFLIFKDSKRKEIEEYISELGEKLLSKLERR
ncbi:hypothetical protein [Desulfurobacterium crinifex]